MKLDLEPMPAGLAAATGHAPAVSTESGQHSTSSHDNRCPYCARPSDDGHHYALLINGDWYWGCGDGDPVAGADFSIRIGHRIRDGEIRCP